AATAIAGKCSRYDASVIVSLVTMSAMLRCRAEEDDLQSIPTSSHSTSYTAALERARSRADARNHAASSAQPDPATLSALPAPVARPGRCAPSRSAPLALILRRDAAWLRAAAAVAQSEPAGLGPQASRVRDHLASHGASFLADLVATIDLPPDEIEDALWELVGAGRATADGFASLRVLVSRRRGEVKSHFDRMTAAAAAAIPVRKWQDAIRKARTRDRERPGQALRS